MNVFDPARQSRYLVYGFLFQIFCFITNFIALLFLAWLLFDIVMKGSGRLSVDFLTSYPSRFPEKAGVYSALTGTVWVMVLTALIAVPTGIGAAIYLEEYAKPGRFIRFIKLNIQNLAGVPSIIYGILGMTLFVKGMSLGESLIAGVMTMALLILPIITIAAQEALRAVPESFRLAGFGIGMTRWQVIRHQVFPVALPMTMTGIILALSRAIGESAPLLLIGALSFVAYVPYGPLDGFTVLPIQIYNWTSRPQAGFHDAAAGAILVLLVILLFMNAVAVYFRIRFRRGPAHS